MATVSVLLAILCGTFGVVSTRGEFKGGGLRSSAAVWGAVAGGLSAPDSPGLSPVSCCMA